MVPPHGIEPRFSDSISLCCQLTPPNCGFHVLNVSHVLSWPPLGPRFQDLGDLGDMESLRVTNPAHRQQCFKSVLLVVSVGFEPTSLVS